MLCPFLTKTPLIELSFTAATRPFRGLDNPLRSCGVKVDRVIAPDLDAVPNEGLTPVAPIEVPAIAIRRTSNPRPAPGAPVAVVYTRTTVTARSKSEKSASCVHTSASLTSAVAAIRVS